MGNERFNRTQLNMMGTLEPEQKKEWKKHVGFLAHAYNCTRQDSTRQSPYFLMFGCEPRLPIDLAFGIDINQEDRPMSSYIYNLKRRMQESHKIATATSDAAKSHQKKMFDRKAKATVLNVGDRVLVKILAFDGKHKIQDKWEQDPYIITGQPNIDIPVYELQKENKTGRKRTFHRNVLLPIGTLFDDRPVPKPRASKSQPRPRKSRQESHPQPLQVSDSEDYVDITVRRFTREDSNQMTDDNPPPELHDNSYEDALSSTIEVALSDDNEENEITNEDNIEDTEENESNENDTQADNRAHAEESDSSSENEDTSAKTPPVQRPLRTRRPPQWKSRVYYVSSSIFHQLGKACTYTPRIT